MAETLTIVETNTGTVEIAPPGTTGPQGLPGATGPAGADGAAGPDGPSGPEGATGPPGPPGADGASAYEVAVADGFVGDEAAWLASLVGPAGAAGAAGADGADGATGAEGPQGPAGADGADGEGVPVGGTTGQVLGKTSATDFDTEWIDPPEGGTGGGVSQASVFLLMGA